MELKIMGSDVGLAVLTMATSHPQTLQRPLVFVTWQFVLLLNDTETLQQPENMKRSARKLAGSRLDSSSAPVAALMWRFGLSGDTYRPGGSRYPPWCKWTGAVRSGLLWIRRALGHRRGFLSLRAQLAVCS